MVDTSVKGALTLSIQEFNDWAEQKQTWNKMGIAELKGVFADKLKRNLKITELDMGHEMIPSAIRYLEVMNSRIVKLEFNDTIYTLSSVREKLSKLNVELKQINIFGIPAGLSADFVLSLEGCISRISNFKIQ